MSLTVQTLELTPSEEKAARRINTGLALAPRLKTDGWPLALGQRLNGMVSQAAGTVTEATLKRRGVRVSNTTIAGPAGPCTSDCLSPPPPPVL